MASRMPPVCLRLHCSPWVAVASAREAILDKVRELAVVGGTGGFRGVVVPAPDALLQRQRQQPRAQGRPVPENVGLWPARGYVYRVTDYLHASYIGYVRPVVVSCGCFVSYGHLSHVGMLYLICLRAD
ncbi:hypothetical protein GQ55_8G111500 [Panicum hallii var. hallii]|uniref:Uncharacterized protein n=1 Tax=Panicum hallii var. hallii TaxID=1504633 RepID=A0A2T7CMJ8_9POAL|nr:hypothetical protein GQ55_8G111500 [Panicum hallii var. hallii]